MRIDEYYVLVLLVTVCWIWGFNYTFKEGEIFYPIGEWIRKKVGPKNEYWLQPVFTCPYCMASIHGTIWYWILLNEYGVLLWVVFCFALCGLPALIHNK